jgi:gas vesicle protein
MISKSNVMAALTGLGIGAGLALLYAPESGPLLRRRILHRARGEARRLRQEAEELQLTAATLVERGREEAIRQRDGLVNAVEAGKRAYRESV